MPKQFIFISSFPNINVNVSFANLTNVCEIHRPDKIIFNILLSYLNCMCNECKKNFDWLFLGQHFQTLQRYKNTRRPHNIYNESPLHYMFYNYVYLYPCFMVVNQCDGSENDSFTSYIAIILKVNYRHLESEIK